MIGKQSIKEEEDQLKFHRICGGKQYKAGKLAKKFNEQLDRYQLKNVKRIEFLDVTFYVYDTPLKKWSYLCEKKLDHNRWKKWTDNKGGIHNLQSDLSKKDHKNEVIHVPNIIKINKKFE